MVVRFTFRNFNTARRLPGVAESFAKIIFVLLEIKRKPERARTRGSTSRNLLLTCSYMVMTILVRAHIRKAGSFTNTPLKDLMVGTDGSFDLFKLHILELDLVIQTFTPSTTSTSNLKPEKV